MGKRIYVCHTYYHVYIACLKELAARRASVPGDEAALVFSTLSNDFTTLPERASVCPLFDAVYIFEEKDISAFPELMPLKENTGSLLGNLRNRIRLQKALAGALAPYVTVDFGAFDDIYVFCDSDPIGYYLNANRIRYHAVEDGLDCLRYYDTARYDNRGHFRLKAFLAKLGLIFIQNGYARYCIDMEVNDLSVVPYPHAKMTEVKRRSLTNALTEEDKQLLVTLFLEDADALLDLLQTGPARKRILLLTEPLCDLTTRAELFRTVLHEQCRMENANPLILVKRHPRDLLDYTGVFAEEIAKGDLLLLPAYFPMEVLNFLPGAAFDRVVSVYTVVDAIDNAKEKIYLGDDFMDRFEDSAVHRQNEYI